MSLGPNAISATVWEPATLPETPLSPDPIRNGVIGLMLGSLLGLVLAFLLEHVSAAGTRGTSWKRTSGCRLWVLSLNLGSRQEGKILANKEGER